MSTKYTKFNILKGLAIFLSFLISNLFPQYVLLVALLISIIIILFLFLLIEEALTPQNLKNGFYNLIENLKYYLIVSILFDFLAFLLIFSFT